MEATSKGEARRAKMLELIKASGRLSIQEITSALQCSEATARRDLDLLERSGPIIRTIGGAVYEGAQAQPAAELPFADKRQAQLQEKERIAEAAAGLVSEGDVICLTGGTTTFLIARALKARRNITVVTNAVNIACELADAEDVQVVVVGGVMRAKSYELIGPLAEIVADRINITKMFLGVDGVSETHGWTMHAEMEVRIAQILIRRSSEVFPVFDDSKLEKTALFTIMPLAGAAGIITNRQPSGWLARACKDNRIAVHVPEQLP
ncbi:DeoR/GlpR family DNA-binding transcription regulator [Cohnella sp. GCM10020058]|uniref:DeoR/GlpR family DNA-binding transcription regulator n=1 Tax=Cohnella sp. GCM10020058 TaxID=3317330 RepID=UPI00363C5FC8